MQLVGKLITHSSGFVLFGNMHLLTAVHLINCGKNIVLLTGISKSSSKSSTAKMITYSASISELSFINICSFLKTLACLRPMIFCTKSAPMVIQKPKNLNNNYFPNVLKVRQNYNRNLISVLFFRKYVAYVLSIHRSISVMQWYSVYVYKVIFEVLGEDLRAESPTMTPSLQKQYEYSCDVLLFMPMFIIFFFFMNQFQYDFNLKRI